MVTQQITLDVEISNSEAHVTFSLAHNDGFFARSGRLEICYQSPLNVEAEDAPGIAISALVPHQLSRFNHVNVVTPLAVSICGIKNRDQERVSFNGSPNIQRGPNFTVDSKTVVDKRGTANGPRHGLLFGGGIESSFAAMVLQKLDPVLISVTGPNWMNNDYSKFPLKRDLENLMTTNTGLTLVRVSTNLKNLILSSHQVDETLNSHTTGGFLYSLSIPVSRHFGIGFLHKSSELEEALNFSQFDGSLNPRSYALLQTPNGGPFPLSSFNAFPKVAMLSHLLRSPWRDYFYSCLNNTSERWCGECSKCARTAAMIESLGYPLEIAGLSPMRRSWPREKGYKKWYRKMSKLDWSA